MNLKTVFFAAILSLLPLMTAICERSPAEELADARIFGPDDRARILVVMTIADASGSRQRKIDVWIDRNADESRLYAAIVDPAFLANMKYLRISGKKGGLQQWLKTSRGVSRIAGSGSGERVFGSDFTAEDFGETRPGDFELSFAPQQGDSGRRMIRIAARPRVPSQSYSWKLVSIDPDSRLIYAIEYYDAGNRAIRRYQLEESMPIDGALYPRRVSMTDLRTGGSTVLVLEDISRSPDIPSRIFNPAGL